MTEIVLTDKQAMEIVGYFFKTGLCAYCNADIRTVDSADDYTAHIVRCIPLIEKEHKNSYKFE